MENIAVPLRKSSPIVERDIFDQISEKMVCPSSFFFPPKPLGPVLGGTVFHARDVVRVVKNCSLIGKMPNIPPRGPLPLSDPYGMGVAVDIILALLTSRSRIKGQKFVQFGTVRKIRGSFGAAWESSLQGIEEGASFDKGLG